MRWARIATVGAAAACVFASHEAHAADGEQQQQQQGAKWTVETEGVGCDHARAAFERELVLACTAMGTCRAVGVALDAGIDVTNVYDGRYMHDRTVLESVTRLDAYVQQTLFVQVPLGRVRPYLALGVAFVSAKPILMSSLDLGLQFPVL